jgi:uncharacterized protein (DUF1778 family)
MSTNRKPGRPKLPPSERKTVFVKARFTNDEYAQIEAAFKADGSNETDWVRKKLLAAARRA